MGTSDRDSKQRMHTVELLEEAIGIAKQHGYQIRHEWLGGSGGGACEFGGSKWIFVDLALNTHEQLLQVTDALRAGAALREASDDQASTQPQRRRHAA